MNVDLCTNRNEMDRIRCMLSVRLVGSLNLGFCFYFYFYFNIFIFNFFCFCFIFFAHNNTDWSDRACSRVACNKLCCCCSPPPFFHLAGLYADCPFFRKRDRLQPLLRSKLRSASSLLDTASLIVIAQGVPSVVVLARRSRLS